ncbi:hypothetical protein [Actinomadura sp. NTSP31]|uniref:hypothetical protein n=1 Tax=Actinomadura sp. NTSP31 TaxID=1735447 RepID=UPI0035C22387
MTIVPKGPSARYRRTVTLSPAAVASLRKGIAVVVVHGDDPKTLSRKARKEESELVPSLPLAVTAPVLCGVLKAMPVGGAGTGVGATAVTGHATGARPARPVAGPGGVPARMKITAVARGDRPALAVSACGPAGSRTCR